LHPRERKSHHPVKVAMTGRTGKTKAGSTLTPEIKLGSTGENESWLDLPTRGYSWFVESTRYRRIRYRNIQKRPRRCPPLDGCHSSSSCGPRPPSRGSVNRLFHTAVANVPPGDSLDAGIRALGLWSNKFPTLCISVYGCGRNAFIERTAARTWSPAGWTLLSPTVRGNGD